MAKKKENRLSYLQLPLPEGVKYSKMTKRSWSGLNKRQTIDTGALSMESNISTLEAPYLVPSQSRLPYKTGYDCPIGMFGFDDFLVVIYRDTGEIDGESVKQIKVDYISHEKGIFTGILKTEDATEDDDYPRSVVQFNVYDTPTDPVTGQYIKKLLFFPDKKSMFMNILVASDNPEEWDTDSLAAAAKDVMYCYRGDNGKVYYTVATDVDGNRYVKQSGGAGYFILDSMDVLVKEYTNTKSPYLPPDTASHNYYYRNAHNNDVYRWVDDESDSENSGWKVSVPPAFPPIKYAAVHLSRLFGVDDDRVYASGYNDYTNWNLDTVGEYNESNAWCSPAQSNTKAGGAFTGITVFQSHIVCFKRDFMHELYNTKNPFRIQDIYAEGAIDHRTIQDVDGRLIFVSDDDVKIYTGSNPRIIGYYLNMKRFVYAVSGTDGRNYYLYCEDADGNRHLFVYDTLIEQWSEQEISYTVLSFAHNKNGVYMLTSNDVVYKMDTEEYMHEWSFETDLITAETIDIKHIKKIQLFADIAEDAKVDVYMLYGDEKFDAATSHLVYSSSGYGQKVIRVKPRKTANYGIKLHFEGYGYVKLYEMELSIEAGGDLYV